MKKAAALILALILILGCASAMSDGFEGVWIVVTMYRAPSAMIDALVIHESGSAFMVSDYMAAGSRGTHLVTEFTWREIPGNGIRLTKVSDDDTTRDFYLDDNGMLRSAEIPSLVYYRLSPEEFGY